MHLRPFEIGLIATFAIAAIVGIFMMSNVQSDPGTEVHVYGEKVTIWGTFNGEKLSTIINDLKRTNKGFDVVTYIEKDARTFNSELLNAIAEGKSPDLVIIPHDLLVTYRTKLVSIPKEGSGSIDERSFKDQYIDGTEIFMRSDGTYGIPFAVDPLVMYWNRDMFSASGLSLPPKTWESLLGKTIPAVTKKGDGKDLSQSAVALGEYINISHAKDILVMLFLQTGSPIVAEENGKYAVTIRRTQENGLTPVDAVLPFYTQFALPTKEAYSWSRARYLDRTEFVNDTLGLYFGLGSEREKIDRENPNLNFDIARVPQGGGATVERNYGVFYAFAIPRASQNQSGAFQVALELASSENSKKIADAFDLAPVKRVLFGAPTGDSFKDVIYQSALIARGWLDPAPRESGEVFRLMIEGVLAGQARASGVIADGVESLENLFK